MQLAEWGDDILERHNLLSHACKGAGRFSAGIRCPARLCYHPPMPLSWNEILQRAIAFSKEWTGVRSEQAEKQTFWNEFFNVFGVQRRTVASFEEPVKNLSGDYGYIDLFWRRTVLVEQPFQNDRQRIEHLFALYERLTAPLIAPVKNRRRKAYLN